MGESLKTGDSKAVIFAYVRVRPDYQFPSASVATLTWRMLYRLDPDAVVIVDVFAKKTRATPATILATGRERLRRYDQATQSEG